MKRAMLIVVAALLVLLVYPSTHPLAKSPMVGQLDQPSIISPKANGDPIAYSDDSDGDSGDSDDVAGSRGKGAGLSMSDGSSGATVAPMGISLVFKMWWNYMIWIR
jgi:hypothetical protein